MDKCAAKKLFVVMYLGVFAAGMGLITNGVIDVVAFASAGIVLSAEAIVFTMLYASIFHGHEPAHEAPMPSMKVTEVAKPELAHA